MSDPKNVTPHQTMPWVDRVNLFFHYRRYIKLLGRRWPLVLLFTAVGTAIMSFYAVNKPNIYQATSVIGVAPRLASRANPNATMVVEELNFFFDNQVALLRSPEVLTPVEVKLRGLGFTNTPEVLSPRATRDKGNLIISVRSTDLDYAKSFSIQWALSFIEVKNQKKEQLVATDTKTTTAEIARFESKLTKTRDDIYKFTSKHNLDSIKETGDYNQKRLDALLDEKQLLETTLKRLEGQTSLELATAGLNGVKSSAPSAKDSSNNQPAEKSLSDPLAAYLGDSKYPQYWLQLRDLERKQRDFAATLKPAHPYLMQGKDQINDLKQKIAGELELIEEKRLARIKSLKSDIDILGPVIQENKEKVLFTQQIQTEFGRLKDDESSTKDLLESLNKSLNALDLTPVDQSQFDLLSTGVASRTPVEPNRQRLVITGFALGLLLGIGLIYFLDKMDDRLELAEEIEAALGEPVLGQLPQVPKTSNAASLVVTDLDEHNMFSEALRGVRSAVLLGFKNERQKVLCVTSAVPGDGKTTFTTNFAITLAIAGHRVLLVDADLRRGNTQSFFGNDRNPGFSDVLKGESHWTDVLRGTPVETLKVIHTGKLPQNPGELLISPIPAELIKEAKESFDYIIFDCPPLTAIDDTFSLAPLTDGVLFVVRSAQTSMRFAKTSLNAIRQRGAKIVGLVLNGITPDNPYYYYQRYYHGYYVQDPSQKAALESSPAMPVRKMAQSKRSLNKVISIEEEARAFNPSAQTPEPEDQASKVAQFKARRQSRTAPVHLNGGEPHDHNGKNEEAHS